MRYLLLAALAVARPASAFEVEAAIQAAVRESRAGREEAAARRARLVELIKTSGHKRHPDYPGSSLNMTIRNGYTVKWWEGKPWPAGAVRDSDPTTHLGVVLEDDGTLTFTTFIHDRDVWTGDKTVRTTRGFRYTVDAATGRVLSVDETLESVFARYGGFRGEHRSLAPESDAEYRALWPWVLNAFAAVSLDELAAKWRAAGSPEAGLKASWTKGTETGEVTLTFTGETRRGKWSTREMRIRWNVRNTAGDQPFADMFYTVAGDATLQRIEGARGTNRHVVRPGNAQDKPAVDALVQQILR